MTITFADPMYLINLAQQMAITSLNKKNLIKLEGTNGYHF